MNKDLEELLANTEEGEDFGEEMLEEISDNKGDDDDE